MVLKPGREDDARKIFDKWELDFAVVGKLTDTGHMVLRHKGEIVADLPIDPLALASPEYDRPWVPTPKQAEITSGDLKKDIAPLDALKTLMGCPHLASKRWIWEQYDHMVMGDTIGRPGGDAGVVRVHGTKKALAMTSDCTPRYCLADPVEGGRQAVAEAWRNLVAVGAKPIAITDNMNFGNPERPEIMGQFVGCVEGIREACVALDFPVVSGNVSLYNETNGTGIPPTPTIGGVGLLQDAAKRVGAALPNEGQTLVLIGATKGHLGQSLYLREIEGREAGSPPPVNLGTERRTGDFVRSLIEAGQITACHDLSDGGLLVALTEMALSGDLGASITLPDGVHATAFLFGEDQARYLVTTDDAAQLAAAARDTGVPALTLGTCSGSHIDVDGHGRIALADIRNIHETWMPAYMAQP